MKLALVAFAALVAVASASTLTFEVWSTQHNKEYSSPRERAFRAAVFSRNMRYISQHNAQNHTYTLAMNDFGDMTHSEFKKYYLALQIDATNLRRSGAVHISVGDAPASMDWRSKNVVTPVKNQGQCGSCWAFSTTGSLEGAHALKTGTLVSLSEQNLVDCSGAEGNQGCNGGLMDDAFQYIIKNGGLDTEASYPYEGRDGSCHFSASNVGATVAAYTDIKKDDEDDLLNAVGTKGPVSIAIDASHPSFQFYHSGVYDPTFCSSTRLDHGVLAAGYGTLGGKDYWLVKNSWGPNWGLQGYINMARNAINKCGVASAASYPSV